MGNLVCMLDMFGKCGMLLYVKFFFFISLRTWNFGSWTTNIGCYLQKDCFQEIFSLFFDMKLEVFVANEYTFAVVFTGKWELMID